MFGSRRRREEKFYVKLELRELEYHARTAARLSHVVKTSHTGTSETNCSASIINLTHNLDSKISLRYHISLARLCVVVAFAIYK